MNETRPNHRHHRGSSGACSLSCRETVHPSCITYISCRSATALRHPRWIGRRWKPRPSRISAGGSRWTVGPPLGHACGGDMLARRGARMANVCKAVAWR